MPIWTQHTETWFWCFITGSYEDADWKHYTDELAAFLDHCEPGAVTLNCAYQADVPTPIHREMLGTAIRDHLDPERFAGNALLFDSAIARGVLLAVNWLTKRNYPEKIFGDPDKALAWLAERATSAQAHALRESLTETVPAAQCWPSLRSRVAQDEVA